MYKPLNLEKIAFGCDSAPRYSFWGFCGVFDVLPVAKLLLNEKYTEAGLWAPCGKMTMGSCASEATTRSDGAAGVKVLVIECADVAKTTRHSPSAPRPSTTSYYICWLSTEIVVARLQMLEYAAPQEQVQLTVTHYNVRLVGDPVVPLAVEPRSRDDYTSWPSDICFVAIPSVHEYGAHLPISSREAQQTPSMRKEWIGQNPYPDLYLTREIKQELNGLVNEFVEGYFQQYEDFVAEDNRRVDVQRWKRLKSKNDLHVYEDRYRQASEQDMEPWNPTNAQAPNVPTRSDMPVLLRVGTVLGRLDDLMFGCVNPTLDIMRIRASYVHDIHTAAILCPIVEPTKQEPFRSVIVKWLELDNPFESTNLIKTRDFVYIEATGILHFANGDRVGYHLKHSIEFPQTTPRPNIVRAKMSYCGFYRQISPNVIDVFGVSTLVPGGDIRRFIAVGAATDTLLSTNNLVYCGQMKKMSWMLQQQRSLGLQQERKKNCVVCNKNTSSGIRGRIGKSTCKMCYGSVCFSCKIHWRISFIAPGGMLFRRKLAFCTTCITRASFCDAKKAARAQAAGYRAYKACSISSRSDTAEMSEFSNASQSDIADWEYI